MTSRPPRLLALDVNDTLSDLDALAPRFEEVGAPAQLLKTWFASVLRDGFALTAAGAYGDFATVARGALTFLLNEVSTLTCAPDEAAGHVLGGMAELPLHEDVRPGLERLHRSGVRLVALTNGGAETARAVLERGGVATYLERCVSVEEIQRWKPAPEPYKMVADRCGVAPEEVMLVAAHPWDVDGAKRAGLAAAWINRGGASYPDHLTKPDLSCPHFDGLAQALDAGRARAR